MPPKKKFKLTESNLLTKTNNDKMEEIPKEEEISTSFEDEIEFMNITGHPIHIYNEEKKIMLREIKSVVKYEDAPSIEEKVVKELSSINGIPVVAKEFKKLKNMPEPKEGVIYIVGILVAQKLAEMGRTDYLATDGGPDGSVRDNGIMIGFNRFCKIDTFNVG